MSEPLDTARAQAVVNAAAMDAELADHDAAGEGADIERIALDAAKAAFEEGPPPIHAMPAAWPGAVIVDAAHGGSLPRVRMKTCHMKEEMVKDAVQAAVWGGMAHQNDREIALHIKHAFDSLYGGGKWHVVVGTSFGSVVSHEKDMFIFFAVDRLSVMLWRGGAETIGE